MADKNSLVVWDGIFEVSPDKAEGIYDAVWHGTVVANENSPDATKVEAPHRGAFSEFVASDKQFRVTGTAKRADGSKDGNKFMPYDVNLTGGEGWELDGKKKDIEHQLLTTLQWQGNPDPRKALVFARGKDDAGPFISAGWMRPGNRITLARRYLDATDPRASWTTEKIRDETIKLIYNDEEEEAVTPPWKCTIFNTEIAASN